MDARLWRLITEYQVRVVEAATMLASVGLMRRSGPVWSLGDGAERASLPGGFRYHRHDCGFEVQGPDWTVDFVVGEGGRIDAFDPRRLYEFARRRFGCYGFGSERELDAAIHDAVAAGELRTAASLCYLTPKASPRLYASSPVADARADTGTPGVPWGTMTDGRRRFIAWWQIGCGALGLVWYLVYTLDWPEGARRALLDFTGPYNLAGGVLFFGACVLYGVHLLRGDDRGLVGSAFCQALQVVSFGVLGGPVMVVQAGPRISLELGSEVFRASAGFAANFFLGTRLQGPEWDASINLLALAWLVMLVRVAGDRQRGVVGQRVNAPSSGAI